MCSPSGLPRAIETPRLTLEPQRVEHADEMILVLADRDLYKQTGGEPPSLVELRSRYAEQASGQSPDGSRGWLNWVIRERDTGFAVGAVQATLRFQRGSISAELAWTVGVAHQRRGYATEATSGMVSWLGRHGVETFAALIRPGHTASERVAIHIGLSPTDAVRDGEVRWVRRAPSPPSRSERRAGWS